MLEKILLIKELLELVHYFRKAIIIVLLVGITTMFLFFYWVAGISEANELKSTNEWHSIKAGDSLFVKDIILHLEFYKKGREKLSDYDQREINYRREDSINFIKQNTVHEKYFYKNRTSFIGICIGKDSTMTKSGEYNNHRWIKIKPSHGLTHPPESDKYDFDARTWKNNSKGYFINGKLSRDFFVAFDEVSNLNNDSTYRN